MIRVSVEMVAIRVITFSFTDRFMKSISPGSRILTLILNVGDVLECKHKRRLD